MARLSNVIYCTLLLVSLSTSYILTHMNNRNRLRTYTNSMRLDDGLTEVRIRCSENDLIVVSAWDWRNCIYLEADKWSSSGNLLAQQLCIGRFCKIEITFMLQDTNYVTQRGNFTRY